MTDAALIGYLITAIIILYITHKLWSMDKTLKNMDRQLTYLAEHYPTAIAALQQIAGQKK